ncbi:MAG: Ig-like domain-containing protein [Chloroflexi bacterium]|nr:Ig-like domain-containing protein [Chloroflexota bacterium]
MRRAALVLASALIAAGLPLARPAAAAACGATAVPTTTVYLPNITKTLGGAAGWVTPFIVQNVGAAATTLEVSFYRFSDGGLVTCRSVPGLLPGTSFADVPNNDTDLPGDSQFSVVVRSFGSQIVSVVNEHQGSGERAEALSYVGLAQGATRVALPYVAKSVGGWLTTFVIQGLGTADANVAASFSNADGTRTATLARRIAPGRSAVVDPTVEATLVAGTEYSVLLTSDQPIAAIVNAHNDAPTVAKPMGFSYNGIAATGTDPAYLPYVARNADGIARTTRVLVQNAGTADATPTLAFRSSAGVQSTIVAPAAIKPGRSWSFDPRFKADGVTACPAAASTGCVGEGEHSLVVTGGTLGVLGTALSPATAMGMAAGRPATSRMYLPNITRTLGGGSGWTTPIVLGSAGATSATLRWYRFADGQLAVTQYLPSLVSGGSVKVDPRSVSGLADDTQYAVVADFTGQATALVLELNSLGGDAAMSYEGFAASGAPSAAPVPTSMTMSPATATVSIGSTQQLTATVKDQSGNAYVGVPVTWSLSAGSAGSISASGLFSAGTTAGSATVVATFGTLTATAAVTVVQTTVTTGGFTFNIRTTATADVYVERTISSADAQTVATIADADVAGVQSTYARAFTQRPPIYVFPTTAAYTTGLETVLGVPASEAAISGAQTSGTFRWRNRSGVLTTTLALNWEKVSAQQPKTTLRHELAHMMIVQIAKPATQDSIPAWINEGSARLEEFTIAGTAHWRNENRYSAASMVAVRNSFAFSDLISQDTWNARTGDPGIHQYYQASQMAQLVRDDVGTAGVTRILELMGQGQTFDAAFAAVVGRTAATWSATMAARLQAISATYPGLATAPDVPGGSGLSYTLYGFQPSSTVTFDVRGQTSEVQNTVKTRTVNAYGVGSGYLGSSWPADTYALTATGLTPPSSTAPGTTVTVRVTAVKAASVADLSVLP